MDTNKPSILTEVEIPAYVGQGVCVEYPGRIVNPKRAVQTLGGEHGITKSYRDEDRRLALRYRPDETYCKPAFGERINTTGLVINIKQKRNKKTGETKLVATLCSIYDVSYKFMAMMDFQYLTMQRTDSGSDNPTYRSLIGEVTFDKLVGDEWMKNRAPLHYLPPAFSRLDFPFVYKFTDTKDEDTPTASKSDQALFHSARKSRKKNNQVVSFDCDDIPQEPLEESIRLGTTEFYKDRLAHMKQLFEERPIWSRLALEGVLAPRGIKFNKIWLSWVAYNCTSGPWRTMWIKYGYNPKTDVNAKHYQILDYRFRTADKSNALANSSDTVAYKRSYTKYKTALLKQKAKTQAGAGSLYFPEAEADNLEVKTNQHVFKPGMLPLHRQMFYQLCDLYVPEIQAIVNENKDREPACDKTHGYLIPGAYDKIRTILNDLIQEALFTSNNPAAASAEADVDDDDSDEESESDNSE